MSNWTTIARSNLDMFVVSALVESLDQAALADDQTERFASVRDTVVNEIRMAIATAQRDLDTDTTKIPNSLLAAGCWMIAGYMATGLGVELLEQQANELQNARDLIRDVARGDRTVETPDSYDATPDAQTGGNAELVSYSTRSYTRDTMSGL